MRSWRRFGPAHSNSGPYTYVWLDALTQKVREGGRIVNVSAVLAIAVNSEGQREVLGLDVITAEDGAGWLAFLKDLKVRGSRVSCWSSPTTTEASSRRSPRPWGQAGSAAARISRATC
jgi:Transposase, Mutator family